MGGERVGLLRRGVDPDPVPVLCVWAADSAEGEVYGAGHVERSRVSNRGVHRYN